MMAIADPGILFAVVRGDNLDLPLFVHVLGAMALAGAAATGIVTALLEDGSVAAWSRRLSLRILLFAALPAFVVMRVGAEWIRIEEFPSGPAPGWVEIGYVTAEGGLVFLIVAIVLAWRAARRDRPRMAKAAAIVASVALIAWIITAWAMTAKPG